MSSTGSSVGSDGTLQDVLNRQREDFFTEGAVTAATRRDRLYRLGKMLAENEGRIADAVIADFGDRSRDFTRFGDVAALFKLIRHARRNLKRWMRPKPRRLETGLRLLGARAWVRWEPKGVVGLISPWNYPVFLAMAPLIDVLAAGNRAMIKPSELTPATSDLMARLAGRFFDESELAVCVGGVEVGEAFSRLPFDHLVFTGGTGVGRLVMEAAAKNLVPVTLELGGKCPAIVGRTARINQAVENIVLGKLINSGQMCMGVDYAMVPEEWVEAFVETAERAIRSAYPTLANNPEYVSVINERHLARLVAMVQEARDRGARVVEVNPANEDLNQPSLNKLPPTIVVNPDAATRVMCEEIFGPILPVVGYHSIDDAIDQINLRPYPLALYHFGSDAHEVERVLARVPSGGVTLNGVILHGIVETLPFGGVGGSGTGKIHGIDGFRTFSNPRGVLKAPPVNIWGLLGARPPYGSRLKWSIRREFRGFLRRDDREVRDG